MLELSAVASYSCAMRYELRARSLNRISKEWKCSNLCCLLRPRRRLRSARPRKPCRYPAISARRRPLPWWPVVAALAGIPPPSVAAPTAVPSSSGPSSSRRRRIGAARAGVFPPGAGAVQPVACIATDKKTAGPPLLGGLFISAPHASPRKSRISPARQERRRVPSFFLRVRVSTMKWGTQPRDAERRGPSPDSFGPPAGRLLLSKINLWFSKFHF